MMDTKMEMVGINVERISCKKKYTTNTTNTMAIIKVMITSCIEAFRKRLASFSVTISNPFGISSAISSSVLSISSITSEAFDPAVWKTNAIEALCPFSTEV